QSNPLRQPYRLAFITFKDAGLFHWTPHRTKRKTRKAKAYYRRQMGYVNGIYLMRAVSSNDAGIYYKVSYRGLLRAALPRIVLAADQNCSAPGCVQLFPDSMSD